MCHTLLLCRPAQRKAWRPAIVGSPNPPQGGEDSASSDPDSDDEEEGDTVSKPVATHQSLHPSSLSPHPELLTTQQAYGFEIKPPSTSDCLLYERWA